MTSDIQRAALRAAAKLTFAAVVFGCGGSTEPTTSDTTAATNDPNAEGSAGTGEYDLKRSHHPKTTAQTYCASMHSYETEEQCCKAEVASASFPATPHWSADPDTRVDALTRDCCTVLAKAATAAQDWSWQERGECCAAIGWNAAATCTPWGPPVPPAMPRLLA
jgi:hypothetical protein